MSIVGIVVVLVIEVCLCEEAVSRCIITGAAAAAVSVGPSSDTAVSDTGGGGGGGPRRCGVGAIVAVTILCAKRSAVHTRNKLRCLPAEPTFGAFVVHVIVVLGCRRCVKKNIPLLRSSDPPLSSSLLVEF